MSRDPHEPDSAAPGNDTAPQEEAQTVGFDTEGATVADVHGSPTVDPNIPAQVGHYKVLRKLADGGMGSVYVAEQENPQRTVALKVIRPGYATAELLRRFENEAQVLGLLQHPGIAQIHEAGTADTGAGPQPFFAMELVQGEDLSRYARRHDLGTRERLELMAKVCDAVSHAHQKGVIHRDLKPSNILVDEQGQPKVLDFGVARATDSDLQATVSTSTGQFVGTLPYMSPEQVSARPDDLDTRSDIYALGVVCHELLAGKLPYEVQDLPIPEIARIIREEEPDRLSSVSRKYRGDIETIVGKALAKERERRYESAASMAGDIRRHLNDEPIIARPPSTWYQFGKFARRNRALVTGAALAFVALAAGLGFASFGFVQAARERDRAEAINEYLVQEILASPDPAVEGVEVKVVDVIDRAADGIEEAFGDQPDLEADMQVTFARTYRGLGLYERAESHARRGHELRLALYGSENALTAEALDQIGRARLGQDDTDDAVELLSEAHEARARLLGPEHKDTLSTLADLASAHARRGDYERAIELRREVLEKRRRAFGPDAFETQQAMISVADILTGVGELEEAETLFLEGRARLLELEGGETVNSIFALIGLSTLYNFGGDYTKAEEYGRKGVEESEKLFGDNHVDTAAALATLGNVLQRMQRYEEAEPLRVRSLAISLEKLGEEHQITLTARHNLAGTIARMGRMEEAEQLHLRNLEDRRRFVGARSSAVAESLVGLGIIYNNTERWPESIATNEEALEIYIEAFGEDHPDVATTMSNLGIAYRNNGDFDKSAELTRRLLEIDIRAVGPTHDWVMLDYRELIYALLAADDAVAAEEAARERIGHAEALEESDPNRIESNSLLGHTLAKQQRFEEAEPLLVESHEALMAGVGREDRRASNSARYLAELYEAWGKPEQAAPYRALLDEGE